MKCPHTIINKIGHVDITHKCQCEVDDHINHAINHYCYCDLSWRGNGEIVQKHYQFVWQGRSC